MDIQDMIFPDKVIRVRPNTNLIDPTYLWRLLQLPYLRKQIESAARTAVGNFAIGGKDIKALKVPMPSLTEQTRLASALNAALLATNEKRLQANMLRASAWPTFESALFSLG